MDMTWVTERVALGGGIWNARNMEEVAQAGVTHVLNMQIEFDDRPLAEPHGIGCCGIRRTTIFCRSRLNC